jgi:ribosomal protein S18 acetylase RimI-like enzyme
MPLVLETSWTGRRVSVRRAVDRTPEGAIRFGDVVGDLLHLDHRTAVIDTRRGPVEVSLSSIALARLAPPSTADELALEAVAAQGWRPAESSALGGWLLRASGGFTGRGNSVLPLKVPGRPLAQALDEARAWYSARGLPLQIQVPAEARRLLDAELAELGWSASPDVHVMAARLDMLAAVDAMETTVAETPADAWFARYRDGAGASTEARSLLTRHDRAGFATIRRDGAVVAIGRGAVDDGWLGVTAVEVAVAYRRQGLARAVMGALWAWGQAHGAQRSYLQVSSDNAAAVDLYRSLGYWIHHDYRYRLDPASAEDR